MAEAKFTYDQLKAACDVMSARVSKARQSIEKAVVGRAYRKWRWKSLRKVKMIVTTYTEWTLTRYDAVELCGYTLVSEGLVTAAELDDHDWLPYKLSRTLTYLDMAANAADSAVTLTSYEFDNFKDFL
jgi:hypothetical protein